MKRMFLVLLALGLFMAGCGTTSGGGGVGDPTTLAKKLAADMGAVKERGSITIDGDTVRLKGEVYLKTRLTVPAGVTLDLTAQGVKFELQNGAKLTVDGTVIASGHGDHGKGWIEGGLRIGNGTSVINGSGTIRLQSKGCVLNIWGDKRRLTLDGVTLVGIADNDNSLVQVGGGGALVLISGAITGNTVSDTCGAVQVAEKSIFIMEGGTISGNASRNTTVWVEGSTFTMKGGAITGNNCRGVFVRDKTATFIMEGGEIYGNPGNKDGGQGVAVNEGTFTMKGGAIYGNASTSREGSGVFITGDGLFEMYGGRIQGSRDSDGFTRNNNNEGKPAALWLGMSRSKWGTGGTYTIGGAARTGGSEIAPLKNGQGGTDDTLIAIPAK